VGVAFRADQLLFLLQSYFGATILEITLQLLFVMASSDISTLETRADHLASMLARNAVAPCLVVALAVSYLILSQYLVLERIAVMASEAGGFRPDLQLLCQAIGLAALGAFLALASSQTIYWELSQSNWSVLHWAQLDPDRITLHMTLLTAWASAAFVIMALPQIEKMPTVRVLLAGLAPALLIAGGVWFYG
jgi:hypothetical protein